MRVEPYIFKNIETINIFNTIKNPSIPFLPHHPENSMITQYQIEILKEGNDTQ